MQRIGMTWQVLPEHWEEYKAIHLAPWQDLIDAIQAAGIHNYSIFAFGLRLFAYMEVDDNVDAAMGRLGETGVMKRWNAHVGVWVAPEAQAGTGIQFMPLEQIFFCE